MTNTTVSTRVLPKSGNDISTEDTVSTVSTVPTFSTDDPLLTDATVLPEASGSTDASVFTTFSSTDSFNGTTASVAVQNGIFTDFSVEIMKLFDSNFPLAVITLISLVAAVTLFVFAVFYLLLRIFWKHRRPIDALVTEDSTISSSTLHPTKSKSSVSPTSNAATITSSAVNAQSASSTALNPSSAAETSAKLSAGTLPTAKEVTADVTAALKAAATVPEAVVPKPATKAKSKSARRAKAARERRNLVVPGKRASNSVLKATRKYNELSKDLKAILSGAYRKKASNEVIETAKDTMVLEESIRNKIGPKSSRGASQTTIQENPKKEGKREETNVQENLKRESKRDESNLQDTLKKESKRDETNNQDNPKRENKRDESTSADNPKKESKRDEPNIQDNPKKESKRDDSNPMSAKEIASLLQFKTGKISKTSQTRVQASSSTSDTAVKRPNANSADPTASNEE
jgi:hypothetical protein